MHIQVANGAATRLYPSGEKHIRARSAIHWALTSPKGPPPCGCPIHSPHQGPPRSSAQDWWYRRLLQYTLDISAELLDSNVVLHYKNAAILLSQSAVRDLHRAFITHVGASPSDLVSGVHAVLVCRPALQRLARNPLTAVFLGAHRAQGAHADAGAQALGTYLESLFADPLSGPSADLLTGAISRTVDHPEDPLDTQDTQISEWMMDFLRARPEWALWRPCCSCSS